MHLSTSFIVREKYKTICNKMFIHGRIFKIVSFRQNDLRYRIILSTSYFYSCNVVQLMPQKGVPWHRSFSSFFDKYKCFQRRLYGLFYIELRFQTLCPIKKCPQMLLKILIFSKKKYLLCICVLRVC